MKSIHIQFFPTHQKTDCRLFCFHHSGGGASYFYPWLGKVPMNVEVCAIELPGHGSHLGESLLNSMQDVISSLIEEFRFLLDKPFLFFGHSVGALISFELTRKLRDNEFRLPEKLIVSACRSPHIPIRRAPIHNLPRTEFLLELKKYNGISKEIFDNQEIMDLFLPVLRADFSISENYSYVAGKPLPCEIIAFSGKDDPTVDKNDIVAWELHTSLKFNHHSFPGDHFYIRSHQDIVLDLMKKYL